MMAFNQQLDHTQLLSQCFHESLLQGGQRSSSHTVAISSIRSMYMVNGQSDLQGQHTNKDIWKKEQEKYVSVLIIVLRIKVLMN